MFGDIVCIVCCTKKMYVHATTKNIYVRENTLRWIKRSSYTPLCSQLVRHLFYVSWTKENNFLHHPGSMFQNNTFSIIFESKYHIQYYLWIKVSYYTPLCLIRHLQLVSSINNSLRHHHPVSNHRPVSNIAKTIWLS